MQVTPTPIPPGQVVVIATVENSITKLFTYLQAQNPYFRNNGISEKDLEKYLDRQWLERNPYQREEDNLKNSISSMKEREIELLEKSSFGNLLKKQFPYHPSSFGKVLETIPDFFFTQKSKRELFALIDQIGKEKTELSELNKAVHRYTDQVHSSFHEIGKFLKIWMGLAGKAYEAALLKQPKQDLLSQLMGTLWEPMDFGRDPGSTIERCFESLPADPILLKAAFLAALQDPEGRTKINELIEASSLFGLPFNFNPPYSPSNIDIDHSEKWARIQLLAKSTGNTSLTSAEIRAQEEFMNSRAPSAFVGIRNLEKYGSSIRVLDVITDRTPRTRSRKALLQTGEFISAHPFTEKEISEAKPEDLDSPLYNQSLLAIPKPEDWVY